MSGSSSSSSSSSTVAAAASATSSASPSGGEGPASSRPRVPHSSGCALSLLRPSAALPQESSALIKRLIWDYAGVMSGGAYERVAGAAAALRVAFEATFAVGKSLGMKCSEGLAVTEVLDGKQAGLLGVRVGDQVTSVGGRRVATQAEFVAVYQAKLKEHAARCQAAGDKKIRSHFTVRFWGGR